MPTPPGSAPPLTVPPRPHHNLPPAHTVFVGRRGELATVRQLLGRNRLVTLTGPGGVGKSRLALQAAAESLPDFPSGVYLVPLAEAHTADLFAAGLAEALQVPASRGADLWTVLANFLRPLELLLLLDNLERLVPHAGRLAGLLQQAPGVRVLATSRRRLGVEGEQVFRVTGLRLPGGTTAQALGGSDAAQLFVQSAQRVCPDFVLDDVNGTAVSRICWLVGGLPLALELAGSWVRAMRCDEVAAEIERDPDFLAAGWQDTAGRQRSLRAVFDHSWALLEEAERQVLPPLAVFAGGFRREAAQAAAGAGRELLTALVDKSFLHWDTLAGRYTIHPVLHRYVEEKLGQDPAAAGRARDRHCAYFLGLVEERERRLLGPEQLPVLREIGSEMDNVRAAWKWAGDHGRRELIATALSGLFQFYETRSWFAEGAAMMDQAAGGLGRDRAAADALVWQLRARQGHFLFRAGQVEQAQLLLQPSLEALAPNDAGEAAFCLNGLGMVAIFQDRYDEAHARLSQALELARSAGLPRRVADSLHNLGNTVLNQGDYAAAAGYYEEALRLYRGAGDRRAEGAALQALGVAAGCQGRFEQARNQLHQARLIFREIGNRWWEAVTLDHLGSCCREQGRYAEAQSCREESLAIMRQVGDRNAEARLLGNIGNLWIDLGNYEQAHACYAQAQIIHQTGRRHDQGIVLANLGNLAHLMGDDESGRAYAQEALEIAREVDARYLQAAVGNILARTLAGLNRLEEAAQAYGEAIAIWRELSLGHAAVEAQAGLAGVAQALGKGAEARKLVDEVLAYFQENAPETVTEVLSVYLDCYRVLRAAEDPRATPVLRTAHRLLQERAARIADEATRHSFLHRVAVHEAILQAAAGLGDGAPPRTAAPPVEPLTRQELEVLRLLAIGLSNQTIAERLTITVGTVKTHVHNLYGKLGVAKRTQAVARGRELGLL